MVFPLFLETPVYHRISVYHISFWGSKCCISTWYALTIFRVSTRIFFMWFQETSPTPPTVLIHHFTTKNPMFFFHQKIPDQNRISKKSMATTLQVLPWSFQHLSPYVVFVFQLIHWQETVARCDPWWSAQLLRDIQWFFYIGEVGRIKNDDFEWCLVVI